MLQLHDTAEKTIGIERSTIHGCGIFALKPFVTGTHITTLTGQLVRGHFERDVGPDWVGIGPGCWIDPDAHIKFLNHSCAPNAAFGRHRALRALRPIHAGEEIAVDYSTTECDANWQMDCVCGAPTCRERLYAIQYAFMDAAEAPPASPLMQLIWRKRASAFPQLAAPRVRVNP